MKSLDAAAIHEVPQSAIDRIAKLLKLADQVDSAVEAASAMGKAQELMARYNLEVETVRDLAGPGAENAAPEEKRERTTVEHLSVMYKWQRELWEGLAELGFCWFFVRHVREQSRYNAKREKFCKRPMLLGRESNVAGTVALARYLHETIERLCPYTGRQRLCGDAITWREGFAEAVLERLQTQRREQEAALAAEPGASTGLTLRSVADREQAANYDAFYGKGSWQALQDRNREREEEARREEERRAALTPEQRQAEDRAAQAERHASGARRRRASFRYSAPRERYRSGRAYHAGREAGEKVSLAKQTGGGKAPKAVE